MADTEIITCPECLGKNENTAECAWCGAALGPQRAPPLAAAMSGAAVPPPIPGPAVTPKYAGFWIRFGAFIIDGVPLGIISWILAYFFVNTFLTATSDTDTSFGLFDAVKMWIFYLTLIVLYCPYFTIIESSYDL